MIWHIVTKYAGQTVMVDKLAPHDMRSCAKLCRESGGDLEQIQFLLGHCLHPDHRAISGIAAESEGSGQRSAGARLGLNIQRCPRLAERSLESPSCPAVAAIQST